MKSDLKGKVKFDDFKVSTLYIDRRLGVVMLTKHDDPHEGTVVHCQSNNAKFKLGMLCHIKDDTSDKIEVLGGEITLSNF